MNYIFPNFFNCYTLVSPTIQQLQLTKNIIGISGNYSFCIWNGGYNNNANDQIVLAPDIEPSVDAYGYIQMCIIDCGNSALVSTDVDNCWGNVIFDILKDKYNCYFSVSNLDLIKHLISIKNDVKLIIHNNYLLQHSISELKELIVQYPENIKYVIIPYNYLYFNKNAKQELTSLPQTVQLIGELSYSSCGTCLSYRKCQIQEQEATLNYSAISSYNNDNNRQLILDNTYYEKQIQAFTELNIDTFIFETIMLSQKEETIALLQTLLEEDILP